jgi:hypothetical protein
MKNGWILKTAGDNNWACLYHGMIEPLARSLRCVTGAGEDNGIYHNEN